MNETNALMIGKVAEIFGVQTWQIRRLFQRGLLPPAIRLGPYRVVARKDLPKVKAALLKARYMKPEVPNAA